jgi:hypothetical protein
MWSYYETSAATLGATSVSNSTLTLSDVRTGTNLGTTYDIWDRRLRTILISVEQFSMATSSTYLNPTNTTQTLTTTYNSKYSTFDSTGSTSGAGTDVGGAKTYEFDTQTFHSVVNSSETYLSQVSTSVFQTGTSPVGNRNSFEFSVSNRTTLNGSTMFFTRATTTRSSSTFGTTTGTGSSVSSTTGTSLWISSFTYLSSTVTFTTTTAAQATTTSSRSSSYLSTATSVTGTSTITVTTTASSVDTNNLATTTVAATITSTTYTTGSLGLPCVINTIIEFNTNEWGWKITGTGTNRVDSIGSSFTKSTFSVGFASGPVSGLTITVTGAASTVTYTISNSYRSTSLTSTRSSSATTTYRVAQSGTAIPFTNTTKTVTLSFTRASTFTLTYTSSISTRSSSLTFPSTTGLTVSTTITDSVTTTFSAGTSVLLNTYTVPTTIFFYTIVSNSTQTHQLSVDGFSATMSYSRDSTVSATAPSVAAPTIGEGWQAVSFGRLQPIGTNLGSNTTNSISAVATAWPPSVRVPFGPRSAASIVGTVTTTLTNIRASSRFGGYGWDSTAGSTVTKTTGIDRMTTVSGDVSGVTEKTWTPTSSTMAMAPGVALAAESIPLVSTASSANGDSQFLSFAAFPST